MTQHALTWFEISVKVFVRAERFHGRVFCYESPQRHGVPNRTGLHRFGSVADVRSSSSGAGDDKGAVLGRSLF